MASSARDHALPRGGESAYSAVVCVVRIVVAVVVGVMVASAGRASAQDAAAGRQKALQCQACHGLDGLAKVPGAPHLAGQVQEYLVTAMRDYRSGARKNETMAVVMRPLSDEDIDDLAAYYAGLDPAGKGGQ